MQLTNWTWKLISSHSGLNQSLTSLASVNADSISTAGFNLQKVVPTPLYSKYPFSLRRTVFFCWRKLDNHPKSNFTLRSRRFLKAQPIRAEEEWVHFIDVRAGLLLEWLTWYRNVVNIGVLVGKRMSADILKPATLDSAYTAQVYIQSNF